MAKKSFLSFVFSSLSLSRVLLQLQTKSTKISYLARHAQSTLQFANLFNFFSINKWGEGDQFSAAVRCFLKGEFDKIPIFLPPQYGFKYSAKFLNAFLDFLDRVGADWNRNVHLQLSYLINFLLQHFEIKCIRFF